MNTPLKNVISPFSHPKTEIKRIAALAVCALLVLPVLGPSSANAIFVGAVDLGTAGPDFYAVLEIGTGAQNISVNAGGLPNGIIGNVGLNGSGTLALTGTTYVQGNVTVAQNVNQVTTSGAALVSGTISVNQATLTQARADALSAAAQASFLGTQPGAINLGDVTTDLTLTVPGVYNINNLNLNQHHKLTLSGGDYVFNVSGDFKISGDSQMAGVFLGAGTTSSDVLFNYKGSADIAFSGGGAGDNSKVYGIILSPNEKVNLAPGTVAGEIISGQNISIVSGSDVINPPPPPPVIPEPATGLWGTAVLASLLIRKRRRNQIQESGSV